MARLLLLSSPVLDDRILRLPAGVGVRLSGTDRVFTLLTCEEEDCSPSGVGWTGRSKEVVSSIGGVLGETGVIVEFKFSLLLL